MMVTSQLCSIAVVCVGLLSRVQAIRDHRGKDCRFLSFRQGDTIFVYHKLTGKRNDLWAGSVCVIFRSFFPFPYFPKSSFMSGSHLETGRRKT